MIEEFVTTCLLLVLGYAYPAFQCFKTVDNNRVEIPELRFWCQYWIVVAVITVVERIGDMFISWIPMYGEMKLALFIYLWYPQTKGTGFVYEKVLRPYMSKHETHIDTSLVEFREKAINLAVYYWQNCTELGSTKVIQFLDFLQSPNSSQNQPDQLHSRDPPAPPPPPPPRVSSGIFRRSKPDTRRPPAAYSHNQMPRGGFR